MGQIYLGQEELKVRRIGHDDTMEQVAVQSKEIWNNKTTGYRSSGKRDASKDLEKNRLHEGRSHSHEPANFVAGRTPITVLHM